MSHSTRIKLRIFVACTQELDAERQRVHSVVTELNKTIADTMGVVLEVVDWKTHVSSMMGRPQQVLFEQLPIDTWDIFVGMLWCRFGTLSGGVKPNTGELFGSGTEEEFALAYELWKSRGSPQILFFRCVRPVSLDIIDIDHLAKVNRFFDAFSASGEHPGFVDVYDTVEAFEKKLQAGLTRILLAFGDQNKAIEPSESLDTDFSNWRIALNRGFLDFFTDTTNEERNQRKREAILGETRLIRLLAHVGYSYLAKVGSRFKSELIRSLESGVHFQMMILNPWTETGLTIAIGEADQRIDGLDLDGVRIDFSQLDVVSVIKDSTYYRFSLLQVLDEYKSLRRDFGNQIDLRFATHDIPATILLTTSMGFFEPYVSVNLQQRLRRALHTFEVQYSRDCYFYGNTSTYFDTLWKMSQSLEEFTANEDRFKERLKTVVLGA